MDNTQQNRNIKELTIDYERGFEEQLGPFKARFQQMAEDRVFSVRVEGCDSNEKMDKLMKEMFELISNRNSKLIRLYFGNCAFSVNSMKLFSEEKCGELELLSICRFKIDNECLSLFSKCNFPELTKLYLENCGITDDGVSHICNGKWKNLKELKLCNNRITSKGFQKIGESNFKNLEEINLSKNELNGKIENIGEIFDFPKLRRIYLEKCNIKEQNFCEINKEKQPLLEKLSIDGSFSGKRLFNLDRNLGWGNLKSLSICSKNKNQSEVCLGLNNICQYFLPNLKELTISDFNMSKKCVLNFMKSKWKHLKCLSLWNVHLENESVKVLSKCEWKELKEFYLFNNGIDDSGVDYLGCSNWLKLNEIRIKNTKITKFAYMNLSKLSVKRLFELKPILPEIMKLQLKSLFE